MRKIKVVFDKISAIQNLKSIMKNVHNSNSDYLPDIAKFSLGKEFAPERVDRAELRIQNAVSEDIIAIPKSSLTFFIGTQHPFSKVESSCEDEAKYIVVPWSLSNQLSRDNLKNLINRIPSGAKSIEYIIYINKADLNQSSTSLAGLNLSKVMAEDETEGLLNKIEALEAQVQKTTELLDKAAKEIIQHKESQKTLTASNQQEINILNAKTASLQAQLQTATLAASIASSGSWTLVIPSQVTGSVNIPGGNLNIGSPITTTNWKSYANIEKVAGNVSLDVVNKKLTIGGASCGAINAN